MTPDEVNLVRASFEMIEPRAAEAGLIFFEELFKLAPDRRRIFPVEMNNHRWKFFDMLSLLIKNLDRIGDVSDELMALGQRHQAYDVRPEDYQLFGHALMMMLDRLLGARLTVQVRAAWAALYDMFARFMLEMTQDAGSSQGFYGRVIGDVMTAQYGAPPRVPGRATVHAPISRDIESGKAARLS